MTAKDVFRKSIKDLPRKARKILKNGKCYTIKYLTASALQRFCFDDIEPIVVAIIYAF